MFRAVVRRVARANWRDTVEADICGGGKDMLVEGKRGGKALDCVAMG